MKGLPSNAHPIKSFENIWDSKWAVPKTIHQQKVVHGAAWPKPDAEIQCGAKNMTLQISRLGSSPLHVNQNNSWVTVFQKLPQCSGATRRRRSIWPPYYGCALSRQDGPATFPVRVAGTPLVVGCPYPPRKPTVECSENLQLRLGGVSVVNLKIKVMGYWYPLMTVCTWCKLSVELQGGEVSIKAPLKGACTEAKDGRHSIALRSGDAEMVFSCSPPPYPTFPPYPAGHVHYPWQNVPHVHQPVNPFPWPVPSPPKPVYPWQTIPPHVHPAPWPPVPTMPPMPWPPVPTMPPMPWPPMPWPPAPEPTWPVVFPTLATPLPWAVVHRPVPSWPQSFDPQSWLKPDNSQNAGQVAYVVKSRMGHGDDGHSHESYQR